MLQRENWNTGTGFLINVPKNEALGIESSKIFNVRVTGSYIYLKRYQNLLPAVLKGACLPTRASVILPKLKELKTALFG